MFSGKYSATAQLPVLASNGFGSAMFETWMSAQSRDGQSSQFGAPMPFAFNPGDVAHTNGDFSISITNTTGATEILPFGYGFQAFATAVPEVSPSLLALLGAGWVAGLAHGRRPRRHAA